MSAVSRPLTSAQQEEQDAYVREIVAAAPPFTAEQRELLAAVLRPAARSWIAAKGASAPQ